MRGVCDEEEDVDDDDDDEEEEEEDEEERGDGAHRPHAMIRCVCIP